MLELNINLIPVPKEKKEEMINRELQLIDEIISTDEELSPDKPPKCTLLSTTSALVP